MKYPQNESIRSDSKYQFWDCLIHDDLCYDLTRQMLREWMCLDQLLMFVKWQYVFYIFRYHKILFGFFFQLKSLFEIFTFVSERSIKYQYLILASLILVACHRSSVSHFSTIQLRLINKFNTDFESVSNFRLVCLLPIYFGFWPTCIICTLHKTTLFWSYICKHYQR